MEELLGGGLTQNRPPQQLQACCLLCKSCWLEREGICFIFLNPLKISEDAVSKFVSRKSNLSLPTNTLCQWNYFCLLFQNTTALTLKQNTKMRKHPGRSSAPSYFPSTPHLTVLPLCYLICAGDFCFLLITISILFLIEGLGD